MDVTSDERGVATVWSLALLAVVMIAGLLAAAVALQTIARQRASTAADIAALAAAQSLGDQCAAGASAAQSNGAALVACSVVGSDVAITVSYPTPSLVHRVLGMFGAQASGITASSRAGPAS